LSEAEAENLPQALQLAERGVKEPQHCDTRPILALALARSGHTAQGEALAASIDRTAPVSTLVRNYLLPTIQAAIQIHSNNPSEAIKLLEPTRRYEFARPGSFEDLYPVYIRGLAYLQIGQGPLAKIEFQKLLDHPGFTGHDVIGALSHLDLWKTADPEIPIYQRAKAEYAALPRLQGTR